MKNTVNYTTQKIFTNEKEFEKLCLIFVKEFNWEGDDNHLFMEKIKKREEQLHQARPTILWLRSTSNNNQRISLKLELMNWSLPEKFKRRQDWSNRAHCAARKFTSKEEKGYIEVTLEVGYDVVFHKRAATIEDLKQVFLLIGLHNLEKDPFDEII